MTNPHVPDPPEKRLETDGGNPSSVLVVLLVLPLMGILMALLMVATNLDALRGSEQPTRSGNTLINYPAPDFSVQNLDGRTVQLSDYAGKTLFVNFWQTTCAPCIEELPEFADFQDEYGDEAAVLAINFDETSAQIRTFLAENDIVGVPIALDPQSDVRSNYGVVQIPTTFVISPEGTVRFLRVGAMTLDDMEDYLDLVQTTDPSV